ncbi:MAG: hypothetical protein CBB65_00165 [Hyphomonadaceae bacterium TMED5]|nr:hypothetical protein [Ponticaulis sp.]OUY01569.1 MAG: hypothetical protein CBB65_00165 [Hyphomonadaceae bacterium TMED5]
MLTSKEWRQLSAEQLETIEGFQQSYPVKVGGLAKAFGLRVLLKPLPAKISGEIRPSTESEAGFDIGVNRFEKNTRQRFTIAHEIGHFLLHSHLIGGGITDTVLYRSRLSNRMEAEANRMAADILMPAKLIRKISSDLKIPLTEEFVDEFAEALQVSVQAMKIRLGV